MKVQYQFSSKPWQYPGPGGWHFVSFPKKISTEIRNTYKFKEEGWGRLRIKAQVGNSEWNSAIWYDSKCDTYLLPIKAEIRKKENIYIGQPVKVVIII